MILHTVAVTLFALVPALTLAAAFDLPLVTSGFGVVSAAIAGHLLYERFLEFREHFLRPILAGILTALYALSALMAILAIGAGSVGSNQSEALRSLSQFFITTTAFLLFVRGATRGDLLLHFNAFLQVALCIAGTVADFLVAVPLSLFALCLWLGLDHAVRRAVPTAPLIPRLVLLAALPAAAALAFLLTIDWKPLTQGAEPGSIAPTESSPTTLALALLAITIGIYAFVRKRRDESEIIIEREDDPTWTEESEPADEARTYREEAAGGHRGQVIADFIELVHALDREGYEKSPSETALRYGRRLPAPEAPELTQIFTRARYGNADLSEQEARRAEELLTDIRVRLVKSPAGGTAQDSDETRYEAT